MCDNKLALPCRVLHRLCFLTFFPTVCCPSFPMAVLQRVTFSNCSRLKAPAHMMHGSHVTYSWHLRVHAGMNSHGAKGHCRTFLL